MKVLYVGHGQNYEFMVKQMFADFKAQKIGKGISSFCAHKWMETYRKNVDLAIIDIEFLYYLIYPRKGHLLVPSSVRQKLIIEDTWDRVVYKFRKNTRKEGLRRIRKKGFTYKLSNRIEDYKTFYHELHVPHIRMRYGKEAVILPEKYFLRIVRKSVLLQVFHQGKYVAGVVLYQSGNRMISLWLGVQSSLSRSLTQYSTDAVYYFEIMYAFERGCSVFDFHETRALLNYGVYKFKRKWGAKIEKCRQLRGNLLLKPMTFSKSLRSFFEHNPFISIDGNDLFGNVLVNDEVCSAEKLETCIKQYYSDGMKALNVFSVKGFEREAVKLAETDKRIVLGNLIKASNPETRFCG